MTKRRLRVVCLQVCGIAMPDAANGVRDKAILLFAHEVASNVKKAYDEHLRDAFKSLLTESGNEHVKLRACWVAV